MAADDAGSSTIVLLLNMRQRSEGAEDMDSWIKYLSDSGGPIAASIIKASGGGKWDEWVTSTSHRAGVDGLRRPGGHGKTVGGLVRFVVRRGAPVTPNGMALVRSNISLSHSARDLVAVDPWQHIAAIQKTSNACSPTP